MSPVAIADRVREHIVDMCASPDGGHLGGSLSLVEILTTLYFEVLRVDPRDPAAADRDILILSKGHGALALYAVLAERGFIGVGELQEGSVWEAAMGAASLGLDNLTAVVDRNGLQLGSPTEATVSLEPLADRWRA